MIDIAGGQYRALKQSRISCKNFKKTKCTGAMEFDSLKASVKRKKISVGKLLKVDLHVTRCEYHHTNSQLQELVGTIPQNVAIRDGRRRSIAEANSDVNLVERLDENSVESKESTDESVGNWSSDAEPSLEERFEPCRSIFGPSLNEIALPSKSNSLRFLGASYNHDSDRQPNSIEFVCKNHKRTRRNPNECEGRLEFIVENPESDFRVGRLTNYSPHSFCEYFDTNGRLADFVKSQTHAGSPAVEKTNGTLEGIAEDDERTVREARAVLDDHLDRVEAELGDAVDETTENKTAVDETTENKTAVDETPENTTAVNETTDADPQSGCPENGHATLIYPKDCNEKLVREANEGAKRKFQSGDSVELSDHRPSGAKSPRLEQSSQSSVSLPNSDLSVSDLSVDDEISVIGEVTFVRIDDYWTSVC